MPTIDISYEFFPPRSEAQERRFWHTVGNLETLGPSYISLTWGALGSAIEASLAVLEQLVTMTDVPVTAHLCCAGQTQDQMKGIIERLEALGITRFLALRGDLTEETRASLGKSEVMRHASELVSLLATDSKRHISVSGYPEVHPESESAQSDLGWLKHKLDSGASQAITQFFFEADTFLRFRDRAAAAGISQPIVPGILPVHDIDNVLDFSKRCGASVPEQMVKLFRQADSEESSQEIAVDHCVNLCNHLRQEGVDNFHLYTLNKSNLSYRVSRELLGRSRAAAAA